MRVCAILHESERLGAGLAIARVAPALRELGCELTVILPGEGPMRAELNDLEVVALEPPRPLGMSLRGWREPPGTLARARSSRHYLQSLRRELRARRPDVVHVNSLHALIEGAAARRAGFPVVLHAHELPEASVKRELAVRAAARIADVVVAVSRAVAEIYASALPPERLLVVHNAVAPAPLVTPSASLRVGTIGSVCARKGADIFVGAAQIVHEKRADIGFEHVGPAGLPGEREFEAALARLNEHGDVAFLGAGSGELALAHWSIFALPSRIEGFPLASLEAMAAGLPVIAADIGAMREQIEDGESGLLVPAADAGALASAIITLADDPRRRAALGAAARRRVSEVFTYATQASALRGAYAAAIARASER